MADITITTSTNIDNTTSSNSSSHCRMVCEDDTGFLSNTTSFPLSSQSSSSTTTRRRVLRFLTDPWGTWIKQNARDFEEYMNNQVQIEIIERPYMQVRDDIVNEAISQIGLLDGFITGPQISGSVVAHQGWADLKPYITETLNRMDDWTDILLGYRRYIAQYQDQIIMYPLDGDLLAMYYRKDILRYYNLSIPRTWDEYTHVAKLTHGKTFKNKTLIGSCVGRGHEFCGNSYWVNLLLSQITQTNGPWEGHLFDSNDMKPLTGSGALEQVYEWLEQQIKYGAPDELDVCIELNTDYMNAGECVLTYNWGNSFKRYLEKGTTLRGNKFGVAPTPGSTKVLDRETMQLVNCDEERCRHGQYYDDIGWVNRAPYLAYGGYACSVNNYTSSINKQLAMEFCAFCASKEESLHNVIPNATKLDLGGQDPFRQSHLNITEFIKQGYEQESSQEYIDTIFSGLRSRNAVIDNRFPTSLLIDSFLETETHQYLNDTRNGLIPGSQQLQRRKELIQKLEHKWNSIIADYDSQGTTQAFILEVYQKLRGVYSPPMDYNHLGPLKIYGSALVTLIFGFALISALWVVRQRNTNIVRASQPFFLVMICIGSALFGSAIIPMGIDDENVRVSSCNIACMSIPWLIILGWTIVFAALFSKLRRLNMVIHNAVNFRRIAIKERDVLFPFATLLCCNLIILFCWTFLAPLEWVRIQKSPTESYGKCSIIGGRGAAWKSIICLAGIVNGAALVFANVEAYKARKISTEFGESKFIGMSMLTILQVSIVGLPVMFLVEDNPMASYIIGSSLTFMFCISILLWIFVPKIKSWWNERNSPSNFARHSTSRRSSLVSGLAFTIIDNDPRNTSTQSELQDYKRKVAALEDVLVDRGINAGELFQEVGLSNSHVDCFNINDGPKQKKSNGSNEEAFPMENTEQPEQIKNSCRTLDDKIVQCGELKHDVQALRDEHDTLRFQHATEE